MSPVHIKTRTGKTGRRYLVYWRRGGQAFKEQYAGSFKTLKEAKLRRDLVAGELASGRDPALILAALKTAPEVAKPVTLADRWDAFVASRVDVETTGLYRASKKKWCDILGATRDPATITVDDVIAGVATLAETLAAVTVVGYTTTLRQVLDFCDADPNPARSTKVKLPRVPRVERDLPTNEQWASIRGQAKKRSRLALRLEEACAFRVGEAAALEWGDIDFVEGAARVRREATKTAAGRRWVPVPGLLLEELDGLLPVEDRRADRRVIGIPARMIGYDFDKACIDAGTPTFGTHALRHRRISLWLRHGIDPVQVAQWSGHARPSESLDTYGHVVLDPAGDEWRDFWVAVYAAGRDPAAAPLLHEDPE